MKNTHPKKNGQGLMHRIDPSTLPVECLKCGHLNTNPDLSYKGTGIRADCKICGSFISFLRQKRKYASPGFAAKIESWLPRMTQDDLRTVRGAVEEHIS